jgi:VanZ family protein
VLKDHTRFLLLWGPVIIVMAVIFYVSSMNEAPLPEDVSDKSAHVLGYTTLGLTVVRAVAGGLPRPITWQAALLAIVITVAYGVTDELHQAFVAGRTAALDDLYADMLGAMLATIACWAWGIISTRRELHRGPR